MIASILAALSSLSLPLFLGGQIINLIVARILYRFYAHRWIFKGLVSFLEPSRWLAVLILRVAASP